MENETTLDPENEVPFPTDAGAPVENAKKPAWPKWLALIALVLLLSAAAFVGMRMLNRQAALQNAGPDGIVAFGPGGGPGAGGEVQAQSMEINVIPAEELPQTQPDAVGLFVRRDDNSLFIGTGQTMISISSEGGGEPSANYDGPVVEVVVTGDTLVYKEVTTPPEGPPASGEIQQEVEEGSIEEIGDSSAVLVWGRKVGDRIIADILVYSEPMIMMAPVGP